MRFFLTRLCAAQDPGLSPATLFSTVFFNQLAANLKNATNLLRQLRAENASLVVNTNGPRERPWLYPPPPHIHSFIHSFFTRLPTRKSGALQQTAYGSPPACAVLWFPPPS